MSPRPSVLSLDACRMAPCMRPQHLQTLPVSPYAQFRESQAIRTVQRLGILRDAETIARYEQTKLASLSGIWFPTASKEVVQVCTDINWWVATFDDRIDGDSAKGRMATYCAILIACAALYKLRRPDNTKPVSFAAMSGARLCCR